MVKLFFFFLPLTKKIIFLLLRFLVLFSSMNWSPLFCFLHFMGHDLAELWSQILHCQPYWNGFLWFVLRTFEQQKQQQLESCFYHQKTGSSAKKIREIWKQPKSLSIKSLLFKFRRLEDYWWWLLKRSLWFPGLFLPESQEKWEEKFSYIFCYDIASAAWWTLEFSLQKIFLLT